MEKEYAVMVQFENVRRRVKMVLENLKEQEGGAEAMKREVERDA